MPPIEITIGSNGVLSFSDQGETTLNAQQAVQWICKTHDYAIQFANNAWPFQGPVVPLSKRKGVPTDPCIAKRQGYPGKQLNSFSYTASVYDPAGPTPIIVDDAIIIVDDGG